MDSSTGTLDPVVTFLANSLSTLEWAFNKLPGSAVIQRYVKSSHQNDPGRTFLELILVVFAIRTLLQSRTQADRGEKHFIQFSEKVRFCRSFFASMAYWFYVLINTCYFMQEVDELVEEWVPEPLAPSLGAQAQHELSTLPVVAGPNGPKPKLLGTGKSVTNLASLNFTGLAGNEFIKQRATETLRKYGLGSCGPPGFYGTLGT